jgi:hypothetical protein
MNINSDLLKIFQLLPDSCQKIALSNLQNAKDLLDDYKKNDFNSLIKKLQQINTQEFYNALMKCLQDVNKLSCEQLNQLGQDIPVSFLEPALNQLNESKEMSKDLLNIMLNLETKINCAVDGFNQKNPSNKISKINTKKELLQILNLNNQECPSCFKNKNVIIMLSIFSVIVIVMFILLLRKK